jgi:hypothetical protein
MDSSLTGGKRLREETERQQPAAPEVGNGSHLPAVRQRRRRPVVRCRVVLSLQGSSRRLECGPRPDPPVRSPAHSIDVVGHFLTGVSSDPALTCPPSVGRPAGGRLPLIYRPAHSRSCTKSPCIRESHADPFGTPLSRHRKSSRALRAGPQSGQAPGVVRRRAGNTLEGGNCQGEPEVQRSGRGDGIEGVLYVLWFRWLRPDRRQ